MQGEIASKLDKDASDTFLWVSLVCQRLTHVPLRRALQELRTLPPGLDAFYSRMMGDVERWFDAEICKEILAIMCIVFRSLSLLELKALVPSMQDFDLDEVEELVAECGSFLTLQGETVWFVHQSAKDFLCDDDQTQILPAGIVAQHRLFFSRTMSILKHNLKRDMYNIRRPGYFIDDVTPPVPDPLAPLRYAAVYWVGHLHEASTTVDNKTELELLYEFLKESFLQWLESLSLRSVTNLIVSCPAPPHVTSHHLMSFCSQMRDILSYPI